ncbi:LuxR C-terminal-related transcriptional regulator [Streptomyces termitum]|uniref:LuxR C-terminal-related transcriptional regulator n=1 Tax=Streptomyces termitum TaxID=67368 RepID=UPI001E537509|nr:response regulator transcription factor [Streptomyces termitum]
MGGLGVLEDRGDLGDVTVVVVDGDPVFRMGMAVLLGSVAGVAVVAEAATADEAVVAVERFRPRVVVTDLCPGPGEGAGSDAVRRLLRSRPQPAVLVVTVADDDELVLASLRSGARGYLLKGAGPVVVERAVRAVADGEILLGPGVGERVAALLAAPASGRTAPALRGLTPREHEVLDLVARGLGNEAIARRLAVRAKTVRNHVSAVLTKLHTASRAEAIVRAREAGLGGGHRDTAAPPPQT